MYKVVSTPILTLALIVLLVLPGCFGRKARRIQEARSHFDMGVSFYQETNYTAALKQLLEAEKLNPDDCEIQNSLAMAFLAKKQYQDAEAHLLKAIEINPKYSEAYNNLGTVYMQTNRLDEAKEYLEKALDDFLYPTPERALFNLGMIYFKRRVYFKAGEYFEQAYNANKRFVIVRYYLGLNYLYMARRQEACEHLCFVAKNFPEGDMKSDGLKYVDSLECDCHPVGSM